MKKLLAFILCFALLLSLTACPSKDAGEPSETVSNEEQARDMYAKACTPLDEASNVTLELLITTLNNVDGDEYSEQSSQTLTYQAMGTEEAVIEMEEEITFSVHSEQEEEEEDEEEEPTKYTEIWYKDQVYAQLDGDYRYSSAMDAQTAEKRYIPALLLDAAIYESVSFEAVEGGTKISFTQPTAAESWAIPEEAQLQSASGSALLNAEGALKEMEYSITYTYGPSEVTTTVQSKILDAAEEISAPEKPEKYAAITSVDSLRLRVSALGNLAQADSITFHKGATMSLDAAGIFTNNSVTMDVYGHEEDTLMKEETSVYVVDYSSGEEVEQESEDTYQDGKLTSVANKGLPSTTTISWEDIWTYIDGSLYDDIPSIEYWADATVTDLGSVYYTEYVLDENFGNTQQNNICDSLWGDPAFLINLADSYENKELTGYLSIDKYTGMPVAAGYHFEGVHTIQGQECAMSVQFDMSYEAPSKGAYLEITDERLPEEEPENKAAPLFYHVTGEDGQEMWLFGTIHVGDERTAYLPQEIYDAFAASDALALECNTELFDEQLEEDEKLAAQVADLYYFSDGTTIESLMEEEEYKQTLTLLKAVGGYSLNMPYAKPYLWSNIIEQFYLQQCYLLHRDQGVEERLMLLAEEQEKEILEIESSLAQLKMSTGFSTELQMWMLEDTIAGDPKDYWTDVQELYELWCAGDEAALREMIAETWDTSELTEEELAEYKPLMEEYDKAMSFDRNEGMLDAAIEYLESGEVIFYAVGLAHLLDATNGLVDALQEAGYTVELVAYK